MRLYNLLENSDNYAKTSGSLWQYYRDEPNDNLADSESFKSKIKITGKTPNDLGNFNEIFKKDVAYDLKFKSSIRLGMVKLTDILWLYLFKVPID